MKIYKYISWNIYKKIWINDIFWSTKMRKMRKWFENLKQDWFFFWIEKFNWDAIKNFYNLYVTQIITKPNSITFDLNTFVNEKKKSDIELFFAYVKKQDKLFWWCIFHYWKSKDRLMMCYKASENIIISWVWLWFYLDYLTINDAICKDIETLSRWKDRNAYGLLWSNPWLVVQKLQTKFLPYKSKNEEIIEINENDINVDTLIFLDPQEDWLFKKAIFWTNNSEDIKNKFTIIEDSWISLEIRKI